MSLAGILWHPMASLGHRLSEGVTVERWYWRAFPSGPPMSPRETALSSGGVPLRAPMVFADALSGTKPSEAEWVWNRWSEAGGRMIFGSHQAMSGPTRPEIC